LLLCGIQILQEEEIKNGEGERESIPVNLQSVMF
jgi:hypothetical protein